MSEFGRHSRANLETCDHRLQQIAAKVIIIKDHSIVKGHRNEQEQTAAYYSTPQRSKLKWPDGKHNGFPSQAIDVQTYPRPEHEDDLRAEQYYLLGLYVGVGADMGIALRTGADWDTDGQVSDNGWDDLFHAELIGD